MWLAATAASVQSEAMALLRGRFHQKATAPPSLFHEGDGQQESIAFRVTFERSPLYNQQFCSVPQQGSCLRSASLRDGQLFEMMISTFVRGARSRD